MGSALLEDSLVARALLALGFDCRGFGPLGGDELSALGACVMV